MWIWFSSFLWQRAQFCEPVSASRSHLQCSFIDVLPRVVELSLQQLWWDCFDKAFYIKTLCGVLFFEHSISFYIVLIVAVVYNNETSFLSWISCNVAWCELICTPVNPLCSSLEMANRSSLIQSPSLTSFPIIFQTPIVDDASAVLLSGNVTMGSLHIGVVVSN